VVLKEISQGLLSGGILQMEQVEQRQTVILQTQTVQTEEQDRRKVCIQDRTEEQVEQVQTAEQVEQVVLFRMVVMVLCPAVEVEVVSQIVLVLLAPTQASVMVVTEQTEKLL
jgi:hypothetical protein